MKFENNWKLKSLNSLEKQTTTKLNTNHESYLVSKCELLRNKPIGNFTIEDLRIMIGQEIGLRFLIPLAIEKLTLNLFAEGNFYEGDLLNAVLSIKSEFWLDYQEYQQCIRELISKRLEEIKEKKISLGSFNL